MKSVTVLVRQALTQQQEWFTTVAATLLELLDVLGAEQVEEPKRKNAPEPGRTRPRRYRTRRTPARQTQTARSRPRTRTRTRTPTPPEPTPLEPTPEATAVLSPPANAPKLSKALDTVLAKHRGEVITVPQLVKELRLPGRMGDRLYSRLSQSARYGVEPASPTAEGLKAWRVLPAETA
jgi:hypothetical protein